ncbi:MAG: glutamate synthase subunit alpha, partial [Candidatus Omnitrophica bacterium]|nr:glutamate synthase subunit alpha [Candidatus Omnitrophota bacterium]
IKMAQGAKPGEGGQLPGHKVSEEIAFLRHSVPGVALISPPPHHDIYSIEDLAQLIYDLKQVNPEARVCVKLVAEAGVGTIAAGVAKGHADTILISGHDGGTGASPISSIKHAGLPWELGVAETQQVLRLNGLRERVVLRTDGGFKTGRDVVMGALLGAEEFGFGTAALVTTGCVMTRKCHLNNCPVGVATQERKFRDKYTGKPEHVVRFFKYIAQEIREILAEMGFRSLKDIVGRNDLLTLRKGYRDMPGLEGRRIDLTRLMDDCGIGDKHPRRRMWDRNDWEKHERLDDLLLEEIQADVESGTPVQIHSPIQNIHRTVTTRISGQVAKFHGAEGLPPGTIDLSFRGTAGQSFGAFLAPGMKVTLEGEANDYVGKGMAGGELVVRPFEESPYATQENAIMGNTVMYGATGGRMFAAGYAGERFCVRNSGGVAVIEGVGDHGCEYMTGGTVVILGQAGRNFGAGMTGGQAFILDLKNNFDCCYNKTLVVPRRITDASGASAKILLELIESHVEKTGSAWGQYILDNFSTLLPKFWHVLPKEQVKAIEMEEEGVTEQVNV